MQSLLAEKESEMLWERLRQNRKITAILARAPRFGMKDWYLGAGCIAQTVWNELGGYPPENNIKDYDLVYFDDSDLSFEAEDSYVRRGTSLFKDLHVYVEIKNEARVHLWYKDHFGKPFEYLDSRGKKSEVYGSVEDAISTWPTTATSIGVKLDEEGRFKVFAPFGLGDLFNMVVRPNKRGVPREVYVEKASRWLSLWPQLKVIPWDDPS